VKTINVDEYRHLNASEMSEKKLQEYIITAAVEAGWDYYHTWNSKNSRKGFPDLVLTWLGSSHIVPERPLIFAELKTEHRKLDPDQIHWQEILGQVADRPGSAMACVVWRPSDYINGNVHRALGVPVE